MPTWHKRAALLPGHNSILDILILAYWDARENQIQPPKAAGSTEMDVFADASSDLPPGDVYDTLKYERFTDRIYFRHRYCIAIEDGAKVHSQSNLEISILSHFQEWSLREQLFELSIDGNLISL